MYYRVSQKKWTFWIYLIVQEPRNRYANYFSPETWDLYTNFEYWNFYVQFTFMYDFMGLMYLQNKIRFHTDLQCTYKAIEASSCPQWPWLTWKHPSYPSVSLWDPKDPKLPQLTNWNSSINFHFYLFQNMWELKIKHFEFISMG